MRCSGPGVDDWASINETRLERSRGKAATRAVSVYAPRVRGLRETREREEVFGVANVTNGAQLTATRASGFVLGLGAPRRLRYLAALCQRRAIEARRLVGNTDDSLGRSEGHPNSRPSWLDYGADCGAVTRACTKLTHPRNLVSRVDASAGDKSEAERHTKSQTCDRSVGWRVCRLLLQPGARLQGGITFARRPSRCRGTRCRRTWHECHDCPTPRQLGDRAVTSPSRDPAPCRHA